MPITSAGDRAVAEGLLLMHETSRVPDNGVNMPTFMSSGLSKVLKNKKGRAQSSPSAPCVVFSNLEHEPGDHVSVDIPHRLTGLPVMGNRTAEGREDDWTESQYSMKIDVTRYPLDIGSKLDQKRRGYSLMGIARNLIRDWYNRYDTERFIYCVMGARGSYMDHDMILPLEGALLDNNESLDEYLTNPLLPPTHNRTHYCSATGQANSIGGVGTYASGKTRVPMGAADVFTVDEVKRLKLTLEEMPNPPQRSVFDIGQGKSTDPMYHLKVTPKMWASMMNSVSGAEFAQLTANALKRTGSWNHPVFKGEGALIDDIYVSKYHLPVKFLPNTTVRCRDDDADGTMYDEVIPGGVQIERGVLLGASAIAKAYGNMGSGMSWGMEREVRDYKFKRSICVGTMDGMKKIVVRNSAGELYDRGLFTVNAAVPTS